MGISPTSLRQLTKLKSGGQLEGVSNIIELGAQNVYCAEQTDLFQGLLKAFDKSLPASEINKICDGGIASDMWKALDVDHMCIDSSGEDNSIPLDLNYEDVPRKYQNHFDLVTNFGTTEHVANQLNAFKVMHELTRVGGLMYSEVPFTGWVNHGLVSYTPRFFWMLCRSNNYSYNSLWIETFPESDFLHPDIIGATDFDATETTFAHQKSIICCLVGKNADTPFVPPWDGDMGGFTGEAKKRYWSLV